MHFNWVYSGTSYTPSKVLVRVPLRSQTEIVITERELSGVLTFTMLEIRIPFNLVYASNE